MSCFPCLVSLSKMFLHFRELLQHWLNGSPIKCFNILWQTFWFTPAFTPIVLNGSLKRSPDKMVLTFYVRSSMSQLSHCWHCCTFFNVVMVSWLTWPTEETATSDVDLILFRCHRWVLKFYSTWTSDVTQTVRHCSLGCSSHKMVDTFYGTGKTFQMLNSRQASVPTLECSLWNDGQWIRSLWVCDPQNHGHEEDS